MEGAQQLSHELEGDESESLIWLSMNFLQYDHYVLSSSPIDSEEWEQQYEIYNHAASILEEEPDEHDLACVLFQLNRAVDFREKLLNQLYKFKKIPGLRGKKHHEAMQDLGIIKPLLKTKLDKIRNNVMHTAKYPVPQLSEVQELAEFTWYFLKATDLIASRTGDMLQFDEAIGADQSQWVELTFDLDSWEIEIRGRVLPDNLSQGRSEGAAQIAATKMKQETDLTYFHGRIMGPDNVKQVIIKTYFSAM